MIAAIAWNAGKGAGIGAATGLLAGGLRAHSEEEHRAEKAQAPAQASQEEQRAAPQDKFKRGMAVCLEARLPDQVATWRHSPCTRSRASRQCSSDIRLRPDRAYPSTSAALLPGRPYVTCPFRPRGGSAAWVALEV